ncbi:MAG: tRNA1(Val) (adenine(37)-N6)-methyltransferase [Bacilli bacterium]|nr:tRNA1(Val) (adenine(37)-N6)-methyltransferase [Bacilli bacterium]MDD4076417.1 tRNA1(Val) (adenine(37)-N6)-methyltransferase [Bacilli bacterium]MDD4387783.1 tRNA1(Val) (adenine(37)-N6)-methyltransferase [Bacilli bacterium]
MEIIHELLGYENIKIVQRKDMFNFSLDSILLADFVRVKRQNDKIIDLGCGNGPIPLFLTLKTKGKIVGIELQEEVYRLAKKSVEINHFENQITIINENIKNIYTIVGANVFNTVVSNPPYFKYCPTSNINKTPFLTIARHEVAITLDEIVNEAKKLLCDGGMLNMIHRTERLSEFIALLKKHNFGLKRLRFVYPKAGSLSALVFLAEAKSNRKDDVVVEAPLYVYKGDNEYTEEVLKIFNFKKQI